MQKFNLQLFATKTPIRGARIVYLFRVLADAAQNTGTLLGFVTENENDISADSDSTATKDGNIVTVSDPEIEITSTSILYKEDTMIDALKNAMLNKSIVECWEVNLDKPAKSDNTGTKFSGTYYQGYITKVDISSDADDNATAELTYKANGVGVSDGGAGVTVTKDQQAAAAYVFKDTTKTGA